MTAVIKTKRFQNQNVNNNKYTHTDKSGKIPSTFI